MNILYEGLIIKEDHRFIAIILKLTPDEPGCDTVNEYQSVSEEEANIWLDDEMARLTTGKGVWDV